MAGVSKRIMTLHFVALLAIFEQVFTHFPPLIPACGSFVPARDLTACLRYLKTPLLVAGRHVGFVMHIHSRPK